MISAEKVYTMLGNEGLWQTALDCHKLLAAVGIPHALCGGVAVCLHGYQRNTTDLDLVIRQQDQPAVREAFQQAGLAWNPEHSEFRSPRGIAIQFLIAGTPAGKDQEACLSAPDDGQKVEVIEGLPVFRLSALIESKLACGTGSLRRTHKDFADVVELIAIRGLDGSFARHLHKSVRKQFRILVRHAHGPS